MSGHEQEIADNRKLWDAWTAIHTRGSFYDVQRFRDDPGDVRIASWERAEVGYRLGVHHMRHPQVGDLYLYRHRLNAPYPGGDHVLMYRAEPGSDSAKALEELRSLKPTPALG
jgi:hypothetical protein